MSRAGIGAAREVGIEIAPDLPADATLAERVDVILRRTCVIARLMTSAEQSALSLSLGAESAQARKYFSLSEKYAAWRDFRLDPKGIGLHGMMIPPGEVVRLTEDEVLQHPLWRNFGSIANEHPPMRGWLATSVCGADGQHYGLLQLTDKKAGLDFDERDEKSIRELAALIGEVADWLHGSLSGSQPSSD